MIGKKYFIAGLAIGILIAASFFMVFAPRHTVLSENDKIVKYDKWSGDTWILESEKWKKVDDTGRDWNKIDNALVDILKIPTRIVDREKVVEMIKAKNPILADLDQNELFERIKMVYSKEIMVELYLENFLKAEGVIK